MTFDCDQELYKISFKNIKDVCRVELTQLGFTNSFKGPRRTEPYLVAQSALGQSTARVRA